MTEERKAAERLVFRFIVAAIALVAGSWLIPQLWDKLSPFIISIPLAAMVQPVINFLYEKLHLKRAVSSLIYVLLILALLFGLIFWLGGMLAAQIPSVLDQASSLLNQTAGTISREIENLLQSANDMVNPKIVESVRSALNGIPGQFADWGKSLVGYIGKASIGLATGLPYGIIYTSFLAMALFFVTKDYPNIRSYLPGGKRRKQDSNTTQLTNSAIRSMVGYLKVQCTFSLMVLAVSWIYLKCFGFEYSGAIAFLAGIMELIPMVGSGFLYIVLGIVFLLTGSTPAGIQMLVLTGVLQLLRRLLEPKLMSNNIGISPLQSLIGMFAGMRFGGILGLIGGPVLMSVVVGAFRGKAFESIRADIRLIVAWFRARWAPAAAEPAPVPEEPAPPGPADAPPAADQAPEAVKPESPQPVKKPLSRKPGRKKA